MKNVLYRLFVAGACRRKDSDAGVSWISFGALVIGIAILLGLVAAPTRAQSTTTGAVSGQVTDQQNQAVIGAEVILRDLATNTSLTTVTNEAGRYALVNVPPSIYDITVSMPGFKAAKVVGQKVTIGLALTVNITMEVGS